MSWSPYTQNGGTTVSIAGDDYALLAADTRHLSGFTINSRYVPKAYDVGDGLVVGASGCDGDAKTLVKRIAQRIEWYHHAHDKRMSVAACARMVQGMLYSKRFFPYYAYVIVCGLDEKGVGAVYSFDPIGSYEREYTRAAGAAASLIMPFLDNQVNFKNQYIPGSKGREPRPRRALSLDSAMSLTKDAFVSAAERHIEVGDYLEFKIVTKDGVRTELFDLKKD